jgi:hypothetical protein
MSNSENADWSNIDWRSYQQIVAGLHALDEDVEVEVEYDYPVNTGGSKAIDVAVWDHSGRYTVTTLIECKFHEDSIEQEVVDSLVGVLDNSDADKGVIIAKNGFQKGALERAEGSGIELWTLRQIQPEIDLENRLQRVEFNLDMTQPQLDVNDIDLRPLDEENEGKEIQAQFTPRNSMIYNSNREPTGETLLERLNVLLNSVPEGEHVEEFEDSLMLVEGDFYQLNSVEYRVEKPSHQTEFTYDMLDHVDLLFRNELDGSREYISLSEALDSFLHNVQE